MSKPRGKFEPSTKIALYKRQPGETPKAWIGFCAYRDLGPERTLEKARIQLGRTVGYNRCMEEWSVRWGWVLRCEAWDQELDRASRKRQIAEVAEMRHRHLRIATSLQGVGMSELQKLINKLKGQKDAKDPALLVTVQELLKVMDAGIRLERASRGEPEEVTEVVSAFEVVVKKTDDRNKARVTMGMDELEVVEKLAE